MDQPVPNVANNVESGNQSVGGSTSSQKPALSANLKKILLVLFLIIIGVGVLWAWGKIFNKKTEQPKQEQSNQDKSNPDVVNTATSGANIKGENPAFNLNYTITGKIISIDKSSRKVVLETIYDPISRFTVFIPEQTVINRQTPDGKPHDYTQSGVYPESFSDLREGTVFKVFTKEDPNANKQLTSKIILIIV